MFIIKYLKSSLTSFPAVTRKCWLASPQEVVDLDISHFSIFQAPLGLPEMPYIDLDTSHFENLANPPPCHCQEELASLQ
jgi:hypothetical protein